jgi:hypothetical protein
MLNRKVAAHALANLRRRHQDGTDRCPAARIYGAPEYRNGAVRRDLELAVQLAVDDDE